MIDLFSLLSIGLAFFVIAVSPGPANISNATIAMSKGRRTSLIYGAGLSTGLVFWGIIAASGMGTILQSSVYLLMALKIFGGIYLLRLAYLSGKETMKPNSVSIEMIDDKVSGKSWFFRGVIMNISNPKTVIAWMAALSVGLEANDGTLSLIAGLVICMVVGFATNAMYSICFSYCGVMNWYQRASRWINGATSFLFSIAGIGLLRSAFNRSSVS
ncbi:threonine efflux protein [Thalassotalea insulae]|uniref:Threonine efflux protein n=1 Tax=Thalassotalea insulae TaxID=2056778 RepID=A0ABQ6GRL2_9GAMM|nr:LysE family translocator [Thalassotalea insulae]GLX77341.1 threonine efflux protein [Thalassotalea insulae]